MVQFLTTDSLDQLNWGTPLGANFLNDGVIRNDFLKNGIGKIIFESFYPELKEEWEVKWKREKGYQAYRHPEVPYFSADAVWSHFAPELKEAFKNYKQSNLNDPNGQFEKKAALYLAEGGFSEMKLKQVLYFQMQQAKWIKPDASLQHQNLAFFGYRNLNDWFGPEFLRLVASFIINSSKVALKEGYKVSREEALYDLKNKALMAFETQKQNPLMTYTDPSQYLREQLRYLGIDLGIAVELWQKVLLFRKMFNDLGSAILVDKDSLKPYVDYVAKQVDMTTYQLPKEIQIKDFRQLQRLEAYLQALSKEQGEFLPAKWKRGDEVVESAPELLMKRYLVDMKEADNKAIGQKMGLKQIWQWQVSHEGWEKLSLEFPELAQATVITEEERFNFLDQMEEGVKHALFQKSRMLMVEEHPEWIEEALANAPYERKMLIFYKKSKKNPLKGLTNPEKALAMLDLPEMDEENPPHVTLRDVGDKTWTFKIYDRSPSWEIATFNEAEREGVAEELNLNTLQAKYEELQKVSPNLLNTDGTFKPLDEVRDFVAQELLRKEMNKIKRSMPANESQSVDNVSTYKWKTYLESLKTILTKNSESEADLTLTPVLAVEGKLSQRGELGDQFKLVKEEKSLDRSQNSFGQSFSAILSLAPNQLSDIVHRANGEMLFFKVTGTKNQDKEELFTNLVDRSKVQLSNELQKILALKLLNEFKVNESIFAKLSRK